MFTLVVVVETDVISIFSICKNLKAMRSSQNSRKWFVTLTQQSLEQQKNKNTHSTNILIKH